MDTAGCGRLLWGPGSLLPTPQADPVVTSSVLLRLATALRRSACPLAGTGSRTVLAWRASAERRSASPPSGTTAADR